MASGEDALSTRESRIISSLHVGILVILRTNVKSLFKIHRVLTRLPTEQNYRAMFSGFKKISNVA